MEGENDDKNMWNNQAEVQDLDVLSAGDNQDHGTDGEHPGFGQAQQTRQLDHQYDELQQDRNSNGSCGGGNYMDLGGFGLKKHKNGSPSNGGGSPQNLIDFNWDPLENFRAKLYTLDGHGKWHDLGTGHFRIDYVPHLHQYKMTLL